MSLIDQAYSESGYRAQVGAPELCGAGSLSTKNFKTKQHGSVAVTTSSGQQWQRLDTCPRGSKVQLMFRFGLPRYEVYTGQPDALAWAPMPDSPEWLKDELSNQNRS